MKVSNTAERLKKLMRERDLRQVDILQLTVPIARKYNLDFTKGNMETRAGFSLHKMHSYQPPKPSINISKTTTSATSPCQSAPKNEASPRCATSQYSTEPST